MNLLVEIEFDHSSFTTAFFERRNSEDLLEREDLKGRYQEQPLNRRVEIACRSADWELPQKQDKEYVPLNSE